MEHNASRLDILSLGWPLALASAADIIMTTVDAIFVGHLGTAEIAAVGLSGIFIWASYNLFKGIPLCIGTFVSQNYGAKRFSNCVVSLYNGLLIVAIASLVFLLYRFLVPQLVVLMRPSPEVQQIAIQYTQIRILGAFGFLSCIAFASFYRGLGRTKIIFKVNLIINIMNVVLDYVLIFGVAGIGALGVKGAAIATVISQFAGLVMYAMAFYSRRGIPFEKINRRPRFDFTEIRKLLEIGIPRSLSIFSEVFAVFIFTVFIGRLGAAQLAANTIMIQLVVLSNISAFGLGGAGAALVGQFIGAGRKDDAYKSGYYSIEMNTVATIIFSIALLLLPGSICSIFNGDPIVVQYFKQIVFFGVVFVLFDGLQLAANHCLCAAGDTKIPFYGMLVAAYLIFIPISYLFAFNFGWGIWGAWLGLAVYIFIYGAFVVHRFIKRAWEKIVLIPVEESE